MHKLNLISHESTQTDMQLINLWHSLKYRMEWIWNGMDGIQPRMVLLQERICSLRGSKFFPVRVLSQSCGKK